MPTPAGATLVTRAAISERGQKFDSAKFLRPPCRGRAALEEEERARTSRVAEMAVQNLLFMFFFAGA